MPKDIESQLPVEERPTDASHAAKHSEESSHDAAEAEQQDTGKGGRSSRSKTAVKAMGQRPMWRRGPLDHFRAYVLGNTFQAQVQLSLSESLP